MSEIAKSDALQRPPLRKADALDAALSVQAETGRARQRKDGRKMMIAVNPALLAGVGQRKEEAA